MMHSRIRVFILLFLFQFLFLQVNSYAQTKEPVKVSLHIVGQGHPMYKQYGDSVYFAMISVTNITDAPIKFWIMSCSWPSANFVDDNSSFYMRYIGCDSNIPEEITLQPHKSIHFYPMFTQSWREEKSNKLKVGFIYVENGHDILGFNGSREKPDKCKKYWSNEVELENNSFRYSQDK